MAIVTLWHRAVEFDMAFHSRMLAKYPRWFFIVDWILEFLYVLFASPITALVVSLLLVPFVMSGSIPVIIWLSVTLAWLLCTVSVARSAPVKQLTIISRVVIVVIVAIASFAASRWYIRWSLLSYYTHLPREVATSSSPSTTPSIDADQLGPRIDELLRKELWKFAPSPVKAPSERVAAAAAATSHSSPPEPASLIGTPPLLIARELVIQGNQIIHDWNDWWNEDGKLQERKAEEQRTRSTKTYERKFVNSIKEANPYREEGYRLLRIAGQGTREDYDKKVLFDLMIAGNVGIAGQEHSFGDYLVELSKRLSALPSR
jgi:hypothetical protein